MAKAELEEGFWVVQGSGGSWGCRYQNRPSITCRSTSPPQSIDKPSETHNERDKEDEGGQGIKDPVNIRKEEVDVGGCVRRHFERKVPCHGKNES
jgi:hypothetical protein